MAAKPEKVFSERQAAFLQHLATRIAPAAVDLDPAGRRRLRFIIRNMLLRRPRMERFQVRLFLFVIRWLPAPVYFRPFERIPPRAQDRLLRWLERFPIKLIRAGFWGIKTLIFMGYYGQKPIAKQIQYLPARHNGNDFLA